MKMEVIKEAGYEEAKLGMSLSFNSSLDKMDKVCSKLAKRNGGHNKFLESICVWLDITAPRYWWQQFDSYRIGVTKQSESTMHTIMKKPFTIDDFESRLVDYFVIERLNQLIEDGEFDIVKAMLPESFLQRRIVCTNYKTLYTMYRQRRTHKLSEWTRFCRFLELGLKLWEELFDEWK